MSNVNIPSVKSGKLTEREVDLLIGQRRSLGSCHADCAQGDRPCPTPDACRLPDPDEDDQSDGVAWHDQELRKPAFIMALFVGLLWLMFR